MAIRPALATRNDMLTAVLARIDADVGAATLKIYSGTQPANGDAAETGTLLATVSFVDPFGTVGSGVLTATDPPAVTGVAAGTAGWFRIEDNTGDNVYDGNVTATGGGGDLQLSTTTISVGVTVDITALSLTAPAG